MLKGLVIRQRNGRRSRDSDSRLRVHFGGAIESGAHVVSACSGAIGAMRKHVVGTCLEAIEEQEEYHGFHVSEIVSAYPDDGCVCVNCELSVCVEGKEKIEKRAQHQLYIHREQAPDRLSILPSLEIYEHGSESFRIA